MSFANLFASSLQTLANIHGKDDGTLHSTLSFFGGIVLILLIDNRTFRIFKYTNG